MHMTTKILAIGLLIGLGLGATTANATPISCAKEWSGAKTKTCTDPDTGTKVTVDADATATAIAAQLQGQIQGQQQIAEGGNATGGTAIINEAADPQFTGRAEIVLKAEIKALDGQHARNVVMLSEREEALGNDCLAKAVLEDHPAMKRTLERAGVGYTMCGAD